MKIKESVRYFLVGNRVYLRDTETYKDYLFNETVFDILQIISQESECTLEMLLNQLLKIYDVEDLNSFQADIAQFITELMENGLIVSSESVPIDFRGSIQDDVREWCEKNNRLCSACLELTYRCNEKCIHCYIDDQEFGRELTLEDYKGLIDQLVKMGCINILLTGGEVSLHPHFIDIAEYASEKGLLVDIYTNGYNISMPLLEKIIALRPNSISFSLYGGNATVHDAVTGISGSFERSLRTILMCKCAGIDTFIKSIGLQQNIASLEELYRFGNLLGIPVEVAKLVLPSHTAGKNLEPIHLKTVEDYKKLFSMEEVYKGKLPKQGMQKETVFTCSAGRCTMSVDPYGNVHPCNAIFAPLGNIKQQSLTEIWGNSRKWVQETQATGQSVERCKLCEFQQYCGICLGGMDLKNSFALKTLDMCAIAQSAYQYSKERRITK